MLDGVLQVGHKHEVAGLKPAPVEGVVVDVTEDGTRAYAVSVVLDVDVLAETVHDYGAVLFGFLSVWYVVKLSHTEVHTHQWYNNQWLL